MSTPIGKISRRSLALLFAIVAIIVIGLLLPGRTGTIIQVAGWLAFAILLILEIGIRTTPQSGRDSNNRRPY
jgi:hypothetical protein